MYSPRPLKQNLGDFSFFPFFLGEGSFVHRLGIAVYTKDSDCNKEEISLSLQRSFLLLEKSCNLLSMQERYEKQNISAMPKFFRSKKTEMSLKVNYAQSGQ